VGKSGDEGIIGEEVVKREGGGIIGEGGGIIGEEVVKREGGGIIGETLGTFGTYKSSRGVSAPSISDSPTNSGNRLYPSIGYGSIFTFTGITFAGSTFILGPEV
jgi:hypothetical protein